MPLSFRAGVLRLNRRGILLAGPPLEKFDRSEVLSFAVRSPFEWQLRFDLDPTLTLLSSMPFRELCLFRFSFGRDRYSYCKQKGVKNKAKPRACMIGAKLVTYLLLVLPYQYLLVAYHHALEEVFGAGHLLEE